MDDTEPKTERAAAGRPLALEASPSRPESMGWSGHEFRGLFSPPVTVTRRELSMHTIQIDPVDRNPNPAGATWSFWTQHDSPAKQEHVQGRHGVGLIDPKSQRGDNSGGRGSSGDKNCTLRSVSPMLLINLSYINLIESYPNNIPP